MSDTNTEAGGTNSNRSEPVPVARAPLRAARQGTIPAYKTDKVRIPPLFKVANKPVEIGCTKAVSTIMCCDGSSIAMVTQLSSERSNFGSGPAFIWPLVQKLRGDLDEARNKYKTDLTMVRRDPDDPSRIWSRTKRGNDGTTKTTLWNLMIHFPEKVGENQRNFCDQWRTMFVRLLNGAYCQSKFRGENTMAYDAGDLSVKMKVKPYLSDYLTIKHTLQALEYLYGDEILLVRPMNESA